MSTLMFWNKQNGSNQSNEMKNGKKNWLHSPDLLVNAHVAFQVKFLGKCSVDQPKGIDVVKDAIRRLQISQQMKKAEQGSNLKIKKVEITVSIDGVTVQELRTQNILHQFPLYRISYCADEKGVKKYLAFIAKTTEITNSSASSPMSNGSSDSVVPSMEQEKHECFVFISSKFASDITLTIGQAFDLAYRRYKNDTGKVTELGMLQTKNKQLEKMVTAYKNRMKEIVEMLPKSELEHFLNVHGLKDIYEVPTDADSETSHSNGKKTPDLGIDVSAPGHDDQVLIETSDSVKLYPPVPSRNLQSQFNNTLDAFKSNGNSSKTDGLLLNSDSDSDFDPRADESEISSNGNKISNDLFGLVDPTPSKTTMGQQIFAATNQNINSNFVNNMNSLNNNMSNGFNGNNVAASPPLLAPPPKASQRRVGGSVNNNNNNVSNGGHMINMNQDVNQDLFGSTPFHAAPIAFDTFNKGLAFGADDFSLESLDPLRK